MIIKPLTRQSPKPIALLTPGFRRVEITTVDGSREVRGATRVHDALTKLSGHRVYVNSSLKRLVHTTGAQAWTAQVWRGRAVTMSLDGCGLEVSSLRRTLPSGESGPYEQFSTLLEVTEWLSHQGVRPGSLSSMAWNLWRSTLDKPLSVGFNAKVGESSLFGGRKGSAPPHSYSNLVALDMKSAYPSAMTSRPYATALREVDAQTRIDPLRAGIARVRVSVPDDLPFSPLPTRVAANVIQWRHGVVEGTYPWVEVDAANRLGCEVEVLRCWAPLEEVDLFGDWWRLMDVGRATLSSDAVRIMKALSNLVWSGFALNGRDSAMVRWSDDYGESPTQVKKPPVRLPQTSCVHVAAEISARVRVRTLLEGLYGDVEAPVHVDTDGVLITRESAQRRPQGEAVGDWRRKTEMSVCEIKAPQLYRYQCGPTCGVDHSLWHYVASGTPLSQAPDLFNAHPGFQVSFYGLDAVLPDRARFDDDQITKWIEAAGLVETSVYGPRLI